MKQEMIGVTAVSAGPYANHLLYTLPYYNYNRFTALCILSRTTVYYILINYYKQNQHTIYQYFDRKSEVFFGSDI